MRDRSPKRKSHSAPIHEKETQNKREGEIYKIASAAGIAPELLEIETCESNGQTFWLVRSRLVGQTFWDAVEKDEGLDAQVLGDRAHSVLNRFHDLGLMHGDINMGNFLLDGDRVYIIDFQHSTELKAGWQPTSQDEKIMAKFPWTGLVKCQQQALEHSMLSQRLFYLKNREDICGGCMLEPMAKSKSQWCCDSCLLLNEKIRSDKSLLMSRPEPARL